MEILTAAKAKCLEESEATGRGRKRACTYLIVADCRSAVAIAEAEAKYRNHYAYRIALTNCCPEKPQNIPSTGMLTPESSTDSKGDNAKDVASNSVNEDVIELDDSVVNDGEVVARGEPRGHEQQEKVWGREQDEVEGYEQDDEQDHKQDDEQDHEQDHQQDHQMHHEQDDEQEHEQDHEQDHWQDHKQDHRQDNKHDHKQHNENHIVS